MKDSRKFNKTLIYVLCVRGCGALQTSITSIILISINQSKEFVININVSSVSLQTILLTKNYLEALRQCHQTFCPRSLTHTGDVL